MRLRLYLFVIALVAITPASHAQNVVLDPNNVLPQLRQFVGAVPFASAFHCGDIGNFTFFRFSCTYVFSDGSVEQECDDSPTPAGLSSTETVYNCTSGGISILTQVTANSTDITEAAYSTANEDMAEIFLSQAAQYGGYPNAVVTISSVQSTTYTLGAGSTNQSQVPAVNVIGTMAAPSEPSFDFLITVIKGAPAVAQVARFRMDDTTWFLLNDFTQSGRSR